ncbi:MFS transporter [Streptosporangiaceae bacterium NEAU-GS5]|nr:MFS transporter [Streptosporangiaceae bacterium NEAU-GS5]
MSRRAAIVSLAGSILLLGIADSMVGSYLVLFAADQVRLDPLRVGVVASATAVGGITVSWLLGRCFDRRPARLYTVAVTVAGAAGLVLAGRTTSFLVLLLLAVTLLGGLAAAFPQLFAMARLILGNGPAGQRSAPLLRSFWSLAWAGGPLLGAAVLSRGDYATLFMTAAGVLLLVALVTLTAPPPHREAADGPVRDRAADGPPGPAVVLITVSVTLFFTAMYAGSVALPLFVTRALQQPPSAVGVLFSVCAGVEVVAALGLAAVPVVVSQRLLILSGMGAFVVYFGLTVLAHGMPLLVAGQVARGYAIAVVGAAGIRFFQDLLAPATGRATTLFANASTGGSLVAGVLAGSSVQAFGYTTTLALCGVVAAVAAAAFLAGTAAGGPRPHDPARRGPTRDPGVSRARRVR